MVGIVAAALSGDLWLTVAILSFLVIVIAIAGWLLCRGPFLEVSETTQNGTRRRFWRAGVEHALHSTTIVPPPSGEPVDSGSASAHGPLTLPGDGSELPTTGD
jgi:hypothetical protein